MKISIPSKIRQALYIITAVGTPLIATLVSIGAIPEWAGLLWSAEVLVIGSLASFKTTEEGEVQQ